MTVDYASIQAVPQSQVHHMDHQLNVAPLLQSSNWRMGDNHAMTICY